MGEIQVRHSLPRCLAIGSERLFVTLSGVIPSRRAQCVRGEVVPAIVGFGVLDRVVRVDQLLAPLALRLAWRWHVGGANGDHVVLGAWVIVGTRYLTGHVLRQLPIQSQTRCAPVRGLVEHYAGRISCRLWWSPRKPAVRPPNAPAKAFL